MNERNKAPTPEEIRVARTAGGFTLSRWAFKIGIHKSTAHRWEAGTQIPRGLGLKSLLRTMRKVEKNAAA